MNPFHELPSIEQLTEELNREKYKRRYKRVLQIYGASMTPTLSEGDTVVSVKGLNFNPGDLVAFYMGNKILVKRCIAGPGQWVDIDADG